MAKLTAILNHNRFVLALSFVLAILIWFVVSIAYSPQTDRNIAQVPIEISFSDSESGYKAYTKTELLATVEVTGKKYVVEQLGVDSLVVSATADAVTGTGNYTLNVQARKRTGGGDYTVVSVTPSTINVMVDVERTAQFDVRIDCVGATVEELSSENENMLLVPTFVKEENATVTVTGPDSQVSRIAYVAAEAQVNKQLTESTQYTASLVAYDSLGNVLYDAANNVSTLSFVTFSYDTADIMANVNLRRVVPLACAVSGAPASHPDILLHEITGSAGGQDSVVTTVSIQGAVDVVRQIEEITLDGTVDFTKIVPGKADSFRFELQLPVMAGVTFDEYTKLSDVYFVAEVEDDGLEARTFDVPATAVSVQDLPASYNSMVVSALKGITVVGPADRVESLTADDLKVTVDGSSINTTGTSSLVPVIQVKNNRTCWITGTYQVVVAVSAAES